LRARTQTVENFRSLRKDCYYCQVFNWQKLCGWHRSQFKARQGPICVIGALAVPGGIGSQYEAFGVA
jgi:hypothetical protein